MSKIDEIRSAMVAAMKAGEKEKKETLSMLLAALKNKQIDKRADLTEEEEIQVIMKEIKQTKETLEMTPADRTDIIEECNRRLTVLEAYAPKMMGEDEIKASPYKHALTRSLGSEHEDPADIQGPVAYFPGDIFLVCSDGLSGFVNDDEIKRDDRRPVFLAVFDQQIAEPIKSIAKLEPIRKSFLSLRSSAPTTA